MSRLPTYTETAAGLLLGLVMIFTWFPSLGFISNFNTLPIGFVFIPILVLIGDFKYYRRFVAFCISLIAVNFILLTSVDGLIEAIKILYGPFLVFVWAQHKKQIRLAFIDFCLILFILDGFLGQTTSVRNLSFLTNEPSHSARFLFTAGVYYTLFFDRRTIMPRLAFLYFALLLNGSLTAICMGIFLLPMLFRLRLLQYSVFLALTVATFYLIQRYWDISAFARLQLQLDRVASYGGTGFYQTLFNWGGPRITLSVFAFLNAPWIGSGLGHEYNIALISAENFSNLHGINFLLNREHNYASSYLSQLFFELGLFFSLVFIALFWLIMSRHFRMQSPILFFLGLVQLILFSSTLMPTSWILIGLSLRMRTGKTELPTSQASSGQPFSLLKRSTQNIA